MDLNGDGHIDILSGSYSRQDRDMAGLFQVLWGTPKGGFKRAEALKGADGKLLLIPGNRKTMTDRICTRPTAVDINADGKLDIISGNFKGTYAVFMGTKDHQFEARSSWLMAGKRPLKTDAHSDPCFVDWDKDGDLDMICGGSSGGVYLCRNEGSAQEPRFQPPTEILKAPKQARSGVVLGEKIDSPRRGTRVTVADFNGDGLFDILIGDQTTINRPAKGLNEKDCLSKLAKWEKTRDALMKENAGLDAEGRKAWSKRYSAHYQARKEFLHSEMTGFVWVMLQKSADSER